MTQSALRPFRSPGPLIFSLESELYYFSGRSCIEFTADIREIDGELISKRGRLPCPSRTHDSLDIDSSP